MFLLDIVSPYHRNGGLSHYYRYGGLLPFLVSVLVIILVGILIFKNVAPQKWEKLKSFFRKR